VNALSTRPRLPAVFVIALDTRAPPPSVATYLRHGPTAAFKLDCQYAAASLGGSPVIAMLDPCCTTSRLGRRRRDPAFFFVSPPLPHKAGASTPVNPNENGQEPSPVPYTGGGNEPSPPHRPRARPTAADRDGELPVGQPEHHMVYAINEPVCRGPRTPRSRPRKTIPIKVFAIDGRCCRAELVTKREFAADAVQYPGKMAVLGMEGYANLAPGGASRPYSNGLAFYDNGTALVGVHGCIRRPRRDARPGRLGSGAA